MTPEIIKEIGSSIVLPICFFGFLAWLVYWNKKK